MLFYVVSLLLDAQPTEMELESYEIVDEVLQHSKDILIELQTYKGAVNEIREVLYVKLFIFRTFFSMHEICYTQNRFY